MAALAHKKTVFTLQKVKKAIKNLLKKAFPVISSKITTKKICAKKTEDISEDSDIEVNDNLHNEALEARLRQMIEASPAYLDLELQTVHAREALQMNNTCYVATFWTGEEEGDTWDLYPELCKFNSNMRRPAHENSSATSTSSQTTVLPPRC